MVLNILKQNALAAIGTVNHVQGPSSKVLSDAAPLEVWKRVLAQAKRSPMLKFKAGAVIWDPSTKSIVSRGTSHPDVTYSRACASVHAEHHALANVHHLELDGCWCIIYILNPRGRLTYTSRPCHSCATRLYNKGIARVIYPEKLTSGQWVVLTETPSELLCRSPHTRRKPFARHMRIPSLYN